jgi:hypothetical protein
LLGYPKTVKLRDSRGNLTCEKFFITIFELLGRFVFQNDIFKLQEDFSELGIRVFFENGVESFQRDNPEVLKRFQKQF